jgi:hypothetical protein
VKVGGDTVIRDRTTPKSDVSGGVTDPNVLMTRHQLARRLHRSITVVAVYLGMTLTSDDQSPWPTRLMAAARNQ